MARPKSLQFKRLPRIDEIATFLHAPRFPIDNVQPIDTENGLEPGFTPILHQKRPPGRQTQSRGPADSISIAAGPTFRPSIPSAVVENADGDEAPFTTGEQRESKNTISTHPKPRGPVFSRDF